MFYNSYTALTLVPVPGFCSGLCMHFCCKLFRFDGSPLFHKQDSVSVHIVPLTMANQLLWDNIQLTEKADPSHS